MSPADRSTARISNCCRRTPRRRSPAAPDTATRARLVCDFLAGMTDGYAARTYKRLFSPDFGSIGDLVG